MHRISWLLTVFLSALALQSTAAETGTLVIKIDAVELDSSQRPTRTTLPVSSFRLSEIKSKASEAFLYPKGTLVEAIPAGLYCLESIDIGKYNTYRFCKPPYIRVYPGEYSNAGHWKVGVFRDLSGAIQLYSFAFPKETTENAASTRAALSEKIGEARSAYDSGGIIFKPSLRLSFLEQPVSTWGEWELERFRDLYSDLPAEDSPPYPKDGLSGVVTALKELPAQFQFGELVIYLTINSAGRVAKSEIVKANCIEAAKVAVALLTETTFIAPVCAAGPCRMDFPFIFSF